MTLGEWIDDPKRWALLAGVAGAAVMATFDFKRPLRMLQQLFVGTLSATFLSGVVIEVIRAGFSLVHMSIEIDDAAAAFLTGAFAILALEFGRAFFTRKTEGAGK